VADVVECTSVQDAGSSRWLERLEAQRFHRRKSAKGMRRTNKSLQPEDVAENQANVTSGGGSEW
jgi:hypothetical protein